LVREAVWFAGKPYSGGYFKNKMSYMGLETCFSFLIHCWPIKARECDTRKIIKKKIQKCNFSLFTRDFLIIFLQNRFYPDVEFYG